MHLKPFGSIHVFILIVKNAHLQSLWNKQYFVHSPATPSRKVWRGWTEGKTPQREGMGEGPYFKPFFAGGSALLGELLKWWAPQRHMLSCEFLIWLFTTGASWCFCATHWEGRVSRIDSLWKLEGAKRREPLCQPSWQHVHGYLSLPISMHSMNAREHEI